MGIKYGKFVSDRKLAHLLHREDQQMCDFGAWHWMLSQAAFKEHQLNYKGRIITYKKGEIPLRYEDFAKAFKWSVGRVQNFFKNLKRAGFINTSSDMGFLIVTICNYEEIQSFKYDENITTDIETDIKADTNRTKNNKRKNTGSAPLASMQAEPEKDIPRWKLIVRKEIGPAAYKSWIDCLNYQNGIVECPSQFVLNWCSTNYKRTIQDALNASGKDFKGFEIDNVINIKAKVSNGNA